MLTAGQYRVLDYETLTGNYSDLAVALRFALRVFGAATGLKICMAISAFGNVLAVTYTASKGGSTLWKSHVVADRLQSSSQSLSSGSYRSGGIFKPTNN